MFLKHNLCQSCCAVGHCAVKQLLKCMLPPKVAGNLPRVPLYIQKQKASATPSSQPNSLGIRPPRRSHPWLVWAVPASGGTCDSFFLSSRAGSDASQKVCLGVAAGAARVTHANAPPPAARHSSRALRCMHAARMHDPTQRPDQKFSPTAACGAVLEMRMAQGPACTHRMLLHLHLLLHVQ